MLRHALVVTVLAALGATVPRSFGQTPPPLEAFPNQTFATVNGRALLLDLYRPAGRTGPLPAIVCIHGGAWRQGNRKNMTAVAKALAEHGYVTATITYRLSGEAQFPAQIQDCKAAVRWLRAHAKEFGIDPNRIGATGHSAGGHLTALLATSGGVAELEGDEGNLDQSSRIQAAVAMGAQTDLETDRIRRVSKSAAEDFYPQFLGGTLDERPATYRLASPLTHLDRSDPPLAFVTGEHDDPSTHADEARRRLEAYGIPTGLLVLKGQPHMFLLDRQAFDRAIDFTVRFFDQYLKGKKS